MLRVERERNQANLPRAVGKSLDAAGELAELPIHLRAEIRKWASRVYKRKYNYFSPQVFKLNRLSFLGGHRKIGHGVAHFEKPGAVA